MYSIEKTNYGFKLTFGDFVKAEEMEQWVSESKQALTGQVDPFGVLVDMRTLKPLPPEAQTVMQEGQKLFKEKGLERSVVVVATSLTAMQFKRLAKESGIYEWERYLDEATEPNWEQKGLSWITEAVDPDA
jgi:hypothetical protein